jgi:hypothetical protein
MPASRIRVRPAHSHGGVIAFAATLGAMMAVPVAAYTWFWYSVPDFIRFFRYNFWIINSIQAVIAFIPFLLFIIWLPRHCQHARWVAAAGATYALSLAAFSMLGVDLFLPWAAWDGLLEHLALLPIGALAGAGIALLMLVVYRWLIVRVIEQDGTLCHHCAYPAGRSNSAACPECGTPIGEMPRSRSDRLMAGFARRRRVSFAAMFIVLAAGYALVARAEHEHRTLGRSFGGEWRTYHHAVYNPLQSRLETAAFRPIGFDDPRAVAVITMARHPAWRRRELQLRTGYLTDVSGDGMISPGEPWIHMNVPPHRVPHVMKFGPSEAVIERLREAAIASEWRETATRWQAPTERIELSWPEDE